jgi:signal transduction histidine kinase
MGSIRVRLTVLYSVVLFGLAALVVSGVYLGLSRSLAKQPVSHRYIVTRTPSGLVVQEAEFQSFERLVNQRALDQLRNYTFGALGFLFVTSLGVGWVVAGRVLAPIERITAVARDIQATDLSRRIDLNGPNDELKRLADTFDDMLARIDDAFEGQRRFIHEASHELRNPLAVIRTNLDVALADPEASADDLRRTANVVHRTAERMSRLVDELLTYARRDAVVAVREPLDVGPLVSEAVEEFTAPADARHLRLEQATSSGLWVKGDRHALRQALANLVANAVRLAPEGTTVRVAAGREREWVWLAVEDQGPGIEPELQDRVFERFWRGDGQSSDGRSGLGLTIVRQIAEGHGGQVRLASEPGKGSAFVIWLPGSAATVDPSA